jgi:hypothetical protein
MAAAAVDALEAVARGTCLGKVPLLLPLAAAEGLLDDQDELPFLPLSLALEAARAARPGGSASCSPAAAAAGELAAQTGMRPGKVPLPLAVAEGLLHAQDELAPLKTEGELPFLLVDRPESYFRASGCMVEPCAGSAAAPNTGDANVTLWTKKSRSVRAVR